MKVVRFKDIIRIAIIMIVGAWVSILIGVSWKVSLIGTLYIIAFVGFMFYGRRER